MKQNANANPRALKVGESGKILLTPDMVITIWSNRPARVVVDEQLAAGDPKNGNTPNEPSSAWSGLEFANSYAGYHEAIIDLKAIHCLDDIYLFGKGGTGTVKIYYGTPLGWDLLVTYSDPVTSTNHWTGYDVSEKSVETRYIRIIASDAGDGSKQEALSEIVLYGKLLEEYEESPIPTVKKPSATMDKFIGANSFVDEPIELVAPLGTIREYHNWEWVEGYDILDVEAGKAGYPKNANGWNPCYDARWDFDHFYKELYEAGITTFPAVQGGVNWNKNKKHMGSNESDTTNPESYAPYADHMYQYAARYGNKKVNTEFIKVREDNKPLSGLGYLKYYEGGNEIDAPWVSGEVNYRPFEYAARMSASYDGHQGRMRDTSNHCTFGIKNADPDAIYILPGLADDNFRYSLDYIKGVKLWSDHFRDPHGMNGSFPGDILNLHFYAFGRTLDPNNKQGVSPEAFELKKKIKPIVEYRNQYLPDQEIWVSEFGYDVNQGSPISAPVIKNEANQLCYSADVVQGQWLVRTYLELAAAGVDRAQMFMIRDVDENDTTQFSSSGLLTNSKTEDRRRVSWYYLYTMKNTLMGLYFKQEIESQHPDVLIQSYADEKGKVKAYALWSPTSNGTVVKDYKLSLPTSTDSAKETRLADKAEKGIETELKMLEDNTVKLEISESPIFITIE